MTQILDAVSTNYKALLCSYKNAAHCIQIVRITNIDHWYFERVVFPGDCLLFEAPLEACLEIHTGDAIAAILSDRIPCAHLRVITGAGMAHLSPSRQK